MTEGLQYSTRAEVSTGHMMRGLIQVLRPGQPVQAPPPALPPGQSWGAPFPPLQGFQSDIIEQGEYREE